MSLENEKYSRFRAPRRFLALSLLMMLLTPGPAMAAFNCILRSIPPLAYGTYVPGTNSAVDVTSRLRIQCRGGQGVARVTLGGGFSGNPGDRFMSSGTDILRYNLFLNASHTVIWGDGTGSTQAVTISHPRGRPRNYRPTIYGRIHPNQDPAEGTYNDSILITVEF